MIITYNAFSYSRGFILNEPNLESEKNTQQGFL